MTINYLENNVTTEANIGPLGAYERLDLEAQNTIDLPYSLQGQTNSECANISYSGVFNLKEKTANSFQVSNEGVYNFTDNNDKAIDSVGIR